jgi:rod shape-determining protein MreD
VRRAIPFAVAIFTALLLQTAVFPKVTLAGAKPELMYMVVIIIAMLDGPSVGAVIGFSGGMAQDFLQNAPKGVTALTLTLLGYTVGLARTYIVTPSPLLPMMLVGLGTFAGLLFYGVVSALIGQLSTGWLYLFRVAFFSGIYNGLLTPVFYPLLKRISEGDRSRSLFGR